MIGADLVYGRDKKQTRAAGRPSWGRKKGNGRKWSYLYDDKWIAPRHLPGCACHTTPSPTFSLSFSLRGNHVYHRGLNRDLPRPLPSTPRSRLSLCFAFVSVTTCPCHLIFSHPPHTRPPTKRHQSHHPIPSPIFRSPHISLRILPRPLTSSCLTLPHLPLPLSSSVFPALACPPCASSRLPRVLSRPCQSALESALQ
jgi:hypothetical protein